MKSLISVSVAAWVLFSLISAPLASAAGRLIECRLGTELDNAEADPQVQFEFEQGARPALTGKLTSSLANAQFAGTASLKSMIDEPKVGEVAPQFAISWSSAGKQYEIRSFIHPNARIPMMESELSVIVGGKRQTILGLAACKGAGEVLAKCLVCYPVM